MDHILDEHINDIEPRIRAICEYSTKQEEPSLQESLASYGWILLDSWICWRTLRFLLKETYIAPEVNKKWFQTPSSYKSNQLVAIWKFSDSTEDYIENKTGKKLKTIIDTDIQPHRNSSAHVNGMNTAKGTDVLTIECFYKIFSDVFLAYECSSFCKIIEHKLLNKGYSDIHLQFSNGVPCKDNIIANAVSSFVDTKEFSITCWKNEREHKIVFDETGCFAMVDEKKNEVYDEEHPKYNFFGNKGFYRDTDLFISTVESFWMKQMGNQIGQGL